LAGNHLFDIDFQLEKNVTGQALHCGMRIDTSQIPAAIKKAWVQMELASIVAENDGKRISKVQRQQAKEAVEEKCKEEVASGRFRRMQQFPLLWDAQSGLLWFGAGSNTAAEMCGELLERSFGLELERLSAGRRALAWSVEAKRRRALETTLPSVFHEDNPNADIAWWGQEEGNYDFLGNELLLWLWWHFETISDTIVLPDQSELTGMFAKTLSLQCPRDESGKETISHECPIALPEAAQAIRSGKLPRRAGLTLVRHGQQYDLVLQAETFVVSGAKISIDDSTAGRGVVDDRIEALRMLHETIDLLYHTFLQRRVSKDWSEDLGKILGWLKADGKRVKKGAA
jgi:hypothetical protein